MAVKEQMNVQIAQRIKRLAKMCATVNQTSLNAWVELAIEEKAARDGKRFDLPGMDKALEKVAKQYLPGKAVTPAQMLAMAQRVAAEDTEEGFTVRHFSVPARKRGAKAGGSRGR